MTGQATDDGAVADEGGGGPAIEGEPLEAALGTPDPVWPVHDERPAGGAAWA